MREKSGHGSRLTARLCRGSSSLSGPQPSGPVTPGTYIDPIYYDTIQPPGKPQKTAVFYFSVDLYGRKCDNNIPIRCVLFQNRFGSLFDIVNKRIFASGSLSKRSQIIEHSFFKTDGGRAAAGFKGSTGDCVTRALAIAEDMPYKEAYDLINAYSKNEKASKRRRKKSSSRTGVYRVTFDRVMADLGWEWTPTMKVGSGCTVHVNKDELPSGRLILRLSRHMAAFIDGELHDSHDCSRNGKRCVYGYWKKPEKGAEDPGAFLDKCEPLRRLFS